MSRILICKGAWEKLLPEQKEPGKTWKPKWVWQSQTKEKTDNPKGKIHSIQTTLILEDAKIISSTFHFVKQENWNSEDFK